MSSMAYNECDEIADMDTDQDDDDDDEAYDEDGTLDYRIMNSTPSLEDLYQHITSDYATKWKTIGSLLGLPITDLVGIEGAYSTNVKWCCNQMLKKWLEVDATASWGKLLTVIKSPAVSSASDKVTAIMDHLSLTTIKKGFDEVMIMFNSARERYMQTRFKIDEVSPLEQPLSVMLIHKTKRVCGEPLNDIIVAKGIGDIFDSYLEMNKAPHGQMILIEGAPGIGKTTLAEKICYQWANGEVLQSFKLVFLLQLQDPALKKMPEITYLLQLLCQREEKFPKITSSCVDHLFKNNGKGILFLLDGLDEFSNNLQKNSSNVIVDIIKQKVLPQCSILVTSRPCGSEILNRKVATRIEILGFTRDEVKSCVHKGIEGESCKISKLMKYLTRQPVINYFLPFNMAILVYLYKNELSLPTSSAELYNTFICFTICRHLGINNVTDLTDLPEPYYKRVQQLAKLSYESLNRNWSFTPDEIRTACPNIKGINDEYDLQHFGLLQAVKHISHYTTYKFIHYSIQEFLAAWHISTLQSVELELRVLEEYLWRDDYFKVFCMYTALTKGQRSFKNLLFDNEMISISNNWLKDQLKCLRLYHCFYEAGDMELCHYLEQSQIFKNLTIELPSINLSVVDIECIALFLTSSSQKEWHEINLYNCGITDHGLYILHRGLLASNVTSITMLQLSYNGLTKVSSSLVSDIVTNCNAKKLKIDGNPSIGENRLCAMLNNVSKLKSLHLVDTKLSSVGMHNICMALINNNTLKELVVTDNNITDDACYAITTVLKDNSHLTKLWIWKNPIHSDTLTSILEALQVNNTLAFLGLPSCPEVTKMSLESLQEVVNKKRQNRGCQVKLMIDFM